MRPRLCLCVLALFLPLHTMLRLAPWGLADAISSTAVGDLLTGSGTLNFLNTACGSGRYLWVRLPGPNRVLHLCEVQVWQRRPSVWRRLSGTAEVAQGMPTVQSSTLIDNNGGAASRAVDGNTVQNYNTAPYTCTRTLPGQTTDHWYVATCHAAYSRSICMTHQPQSAA
jgi:hypothetical protein